MRIYSPKSKHIRDEQLKEWNVIKARWLRKAAQNDRGIINA